jgi:hypothetical protein
MNSLLIPLTEASTKRVFFIDAANVRMVARSNNNPLITLITTYSMTPGGPQGFEVMESPEEASHRINIGRRPDSILPPGTNSAPPQELEYR